MLSSMSNSNKENPVPVVERAILKLSEPTNAAVEPFDFDNLPFDWNDDIWEDIMVDYSLTVQELSALKYARCSQGFQGLQTFSFLKCALDMEMFHGGELQL